MSEEKITVNATCIVRRSDSYIEVEPHPDADEWHAHVELNPVEIEEGVIHLPAMTLRSTAPFTTSDGDEVRRESKK